MTLTPDELKKVREHISDMDMFLRSEEIDLKCTPQPVERHFMKSRRSMLNELKAIFRMEA